MEENKKLNEEESKEISGGTYINRFSSWHFNDEKNKSSYCKYCGKWTYFDNKEVGIGYHNGRGMQCKIVTCSICHQQTYWPTDELYKGKYLAGKSYGDGTMELPPDFTLNN